MPSIKEVARSLARPIARPIWRRVVARMDHALVAPLLHRQTILDRRVETLDQRADHLGARADRTELRLNAIEPRIDELEQRGIAWDRNSRTPDASFLEHHQRLESMQARLDHLEGAWREQLPNFLNAVSTVVAFGFELGQHRSTLQQHLAALQDHRALAEAADADRRGDIARLWERLEFVRNEMMFEMRYGRRSGPAPSAAGASADAMAAPRIVCADKLTGAGEDVRLNLGCGHIPLDGYLNVDARELPGVDIIADVSDLPFEPGTVREISSAHLLEHFPQEMLRRNLLPYWKSLLAPGGRLRAVVPDGAAMLAGITEGSYPFEDFREVLFGGQEYDGDFHFNCFTPDNLATLLRDAGFGGVRVPVAGRRNGKCFEFEIEAVA